MKLAAFAVLALLLPGLAEAQTTASLAALEGQVSVRDAAGEQPGKLGRLLQPGSVVITAAGSSAVVAYSDGSKIRLGQGSQLKLDEQAPGRIGVDLLKGLSDFWVSKVKGRRFRIKAGAAVASVRGTVLRAQNDGSASSFSLFTGEIAVTDALGRSVILSPGQQVAATSSGLGQMKPIPAAENKAPEEPKVEAPKSAATTKTTSETTTESEESLPAEDSGATASPTSSPLQETETATVSPSSP